MDEFYTKEYTNHVNSAQEDREEASNGFVRANILHLAFYRARYDTGELMDGKWDALLSEFLTDRSGKHGDCVFEVMLDQFGPQRETYVGHQL